MNDNEYASFQAPVFAITGYVQDDEGITPSSQELIVCHSREAAIQLYKKRHPGIREVSVSQSEMATIYILESKLASRERKLIEARLEEVKQIASSVLDGARDVEQQKVKGASA